MLLGQPLHPLKCALQIFTDASKEGWGAHLNEPTARGTWSLPESKLHINHLELKVIFLALKEFQDLCSNNILLETGNSQSMTHSRPAEHDSRQAIQTWPDHPNRVVPSPRGVPSYMLPAAPAPSGLVCHQIQQQTSTVCHRFQTPRLGQWMHSVCLGKSSHLWQVVEKLQDYPCNRIILIVPGWPNMPWFWDLVAMSSQIPLCLPNLPNLVSQPFNQTLYRNLSNLNLHAWLLEPQQSRTRDSLRQWQHKLRCLSNQVDFRAPPLKAIADFLLHLFQDRKLQPGTIDGYRSAIAASWVILPLMSAKMRISLL